MSVRSDLRNNVYAKVVNAPDNNENCKFVVFLLRCITKYAQCLSSPDRKTEQEMDGRHQRIMSDTRTHTLSIMTQDRTGGDEFWVKHWAPTGASPWKEEEEINSVKPCTSSHYIEECAVSKQYGNNWYQTCSCLTAGNRRHWCFKVRHKHECEPNTNHGLKFCSIDSGFIFLHVQISRLNSTGNWGNQEEKEATGLSYLKNIGQVTRYVTILTVEKKMQGSSNAVYLFI